MDSGQTKEQVLSEAESYRIIDTPTEAIRVNLLYYKKGIAMSLVILCIFIVLYAYHGFTENQQHDGKPAMLMNTVGYITTTAALVTALLFLV
jgi:hypothetical protein